MAHFAFAWELGGGLGHLVRYRRLVRRLLAHGHRVSFIGRDPARVAAVYAGFGVDVRAAPHDATPSALRLARPDSFAEVLYNCGFQAPDAVHARVGRWVAILRELAPAVLVADYSPSALVACRVLGIPAVASGSGFYTPPRRTPLPPLRTWLAADRARLHATEAAVLANINHALRTLGATPVAAVADAVTTAAPLLLTFREFDHYLDRTPADYLGCYPDEAFGVAPRWPAGDGPRVFAYLDPAVLLTELLAALSAAHARVCLYAPGFDRAAYDAELLANVEVMTEPVDLTRVAIACDAALTNANANCMMAFLLAGKPQLTVPYTLEKYLIGRRLEVLGAGLSAPRANPGDLRAKLRAVLAQRQYRRSAEQFAARYAGDDGSRQAIELMQRLERCTAPECG